MQSSGQPRGASRPRFQTPAERAELFAADQRRLKQEAAERRERRAAEAAAAGPPDESPRPTSHRRAV